MLWPFKRKKKQPKCKHYRSFGEPVLDNMVQILRFSPYKTDSSGHAVYECCWCGHRVFGAFGAFGRHLMSERTCRIIDDFIAHKTSQDEFDEFLSSKMAWHKWEVE